MAVWGKAPPKGPVPDIWDGDINVWFPDTQVTTARLALWTRHSAAAGRSLGERLKSLDWVSAARSGRRSR